MASRTLTVQVPAEAKLVLQLPDGTIRAVTDEELRELGLVDRKKIYKRFAHALARGIGAGDHMVGSEELADPINTIRHIAECAIYYEDDFDSDLEGEDLERNTEIVQQLTVLNRWLLQHPDLNVALAGLAS